MGDPIRFSTFAHYIHIHFPISTYKTIADIAGGKGELQIELHKLGYSVTTYDKRHKRIDKSLSYRYGYFDKTVTGKYDLLVGMHPDEATDVIITEAIRRGIPFCVVPCCVLPTATIFRGDDYFSWIRHLKWVARMADYTVYSSELRIKGMNIVLRGMPNKEKGVT